MEKLPYIREFEKLSLGLFVHFGIYSNVGKGEWYLETCRSDEERYSRELPTRFKVKKNWAKDLVKAAKSLGARYINITTRHHDGFSLYDTKGLSDYDVVHSAAGRDLIREFVDACNEGGVVPFFYHTLLDWHDKRYNEDFGAYMDYLIKSVEVLCTEYGKIGGFWFDGMWDKPDANWQEDRLYGTIRKHQPEAMIINNTGLSALGVVGHKEIDSVTFERGKPTFVDQTDKIRAGEMCQILNDHWGYASCDCNYKSIKELIENLVDCRRVDCNFLLNTGLKGNGAVKEMDKCMLKEIGKWVNTYKEFVYNAHSCDLTAENADILAYGNKYYAVIRNVEVTLNPNITIGSSNNAVKLNTNRKIVSARWCDDGSKVNIVDNVMYPAPFYYGRSLSTRIAEFELE